VAQPWEEEEKLGGGWAVFPGTLQKNVLGRGVDLARVTLSIFSLFLSLLCVVSYLAE
jgi:hypothetical protein